MPLPATVGSGLSWSDHLSGRSGPFQPQVFAGFPGTSATSVQVGTIDTIARRGQTFTPATTHNASAVSFYMTRGGSTSRAYTLEIFATASGLPTGAALASGTFTSLDAPQTGHLWVKVTLSSAVQLTAGTEYAIVVRPTANDLDSTNYVSLNVTSDSSFAGGKLLTYNSTADLWSASDSVDAAFRVWTSDEMPIYGVFADQVNNTLEVWKSTDAGQTWAEVDAANHPTSIEPDTGWTSFDAVLVAGRIAIVYLPNASPVGLTYNVKDFDCTTDTWQPTLFNGGIDGLVADNTGNAPVFIARLDNGDTVLSRNHTFRSMGNDFRAVFIDIRSAGAWTNNVQVSPAVGTHYEARPLLTDGTVVLIPYVDLVGDDFAVRAYNPTGGLGTAVLTTTVGNAATTYGYGAGVYDGTEFNIPWISGSALQNTRYTVSGNTLTTVGTSILSATTVTNPEPLTHFAALANAAGTNYAFWINDSQTEVDRDTESGSTWGTDQTWKSGLGTLTAIAAQPVVIGGSSIGVFYLEGGTVKYDSYPQSTMGTNDGATLTVSDLDLNSTTATMSGGSSIAMTKSDLALGTTTGALTAAVAAQVAMTVSDLALGTTSLATQTGAGISISAGDLSLNAIAVAATGNVAPPPTVREVVETIETDLVADITVSLPTSAQAGDLMLISVVTNGGTITAPPTGWDLVQYHSTQSNPRHALIRRIRQAGDSNTVVVTTTAVAATAIAAAIQDVDQTTPVDVVSAGTNTGSTGSDTMTAGGVTTTVDDTLLVYFGSINSSTQTFSPGTSGMTEVHEMSAGKRQVMLSEARPSAGATGDRVIVASSASLAWNAIMLALRPVAGPGVGDEVTITADGLSLNTTTVATQLGAGVLATAGDLALGTTTDTVTATSSVALTVSDLTLNSTAPSMSQGAGITMTVSDLALGSTAITVTRGAGVALSVSDLALGATAISVAAASSETVTLAEGDLALGTTSLAIQIGAGAAITASDLSLGTTAATIGVGSTVPLTASDLSLGTTTITIQLGAGVAMTVGDVSLGSTTAAISVGASVSFAASDLTLTTTTTAVSTGSSISTTAHGLSFDSTSAQISTGSSVAMTATELTLGTTEGSLTVSQLVSMTGGDLALGSAVLAVSTGAGVGVTAGDLALNTQPITVSGVQSATVSTTAADLALGQTSLSILLAAGVLTAADNLNLGTTLANVQGSIVPQIVRPVSDVTVSDWTTAPLFEKIDETSASDADFIASNNNTNNFAEVALDNPIDPQVSDGHIVRYRYAKSAAAGNARNITVGLYQGTTLIAEQTHTGITEVWTAGSFTLTGTQADSITDYSDLRLRFTAGGTTGGSGGNRRSVQVSWAELQVPGAGTLSALVNMTKSDLALNTQPITLLMAAGVGLTAAGLALAGPTAVVGQSSSAVLATDTLQLGSQPHTISLGAGVALTSTGLALGSTSSALQGESSITLAATGLTLGTTSPLVQVGATVGLTAQDLLLGTTSADLIAEVVDGDQDVLLTAADLALGTQPHTIHAGALLVLTAAGLNLDARPASLGGSSLVTLARTTLALAGQSVATTGQLNATVFTVPGAFVVGSRPVAVSASSELQLTAAGLTLNGAPADLILLTDDSVVLLPATLILGTRPATLLIKIPEGAKTKICQICGIYQSWIRAYYMDANGNQLADYECERGDRWSQIIALQRILQLHYGRDWRRRLGRPR